MKIEEYRGKMLYESDGHGKAVKGQKATSSVQVRDYIRPGEYLLLKSISFKVGDTEARNRAIEKAKKYVDEDF